MKLRTHGYTLIEIMVALAILATSLTILLGTQANSAQMTERANRMALASMLVRSKIIDIEHELLQDGFSDMTEESNGDFSDEGFDQMEWEALVEVIEIPPEAAPELAASVNSQLFGSGESAGALSGSAAVSQWLPMIVSELPVMINDMSQRARKLTLTVSWPEGDDRMSLTVQYFVVDLDQQTLTIPEGGLGMPQAPTLPAGVIQ